MCGRYSFITFPTQPTKCARRKLTAKLRGGPLRMREHELGGQHEGVAPTEERMAKHSETGSFEKRLPNATRCQPVHIYAFPSRAKAK